MKGNLDKYAIKEEFDLEDDIKKEMEKLKNQNVHQQQKQLDQQQQQLQQEDPGSTTPTNSKLPDKFSKLEPGEKYL